MSVNHSSLGAEAVNTRLTWSSCTGGPGRPPLPRRGLPNALPPPDGPADPPAGARSHRLPARGGLADREPVAELRIVSVGVEQRVGPVGPGQFTGGDRG